MKEQIFGILALVIFASPFIALPIIVIVKVWQKRKKVPARQAQAPAPSARELAARALNQHASHLQEIFPTLNEAAGDFLRLFSDKDFKGDLTLAAEMAGLKMLRNSGVDLGRHTPGHILLGALPDEVYKRMQRFMYSWYLSNGIPVEGLGDIQIPDEDKAYIPQIVLLEPAFDAICQKHGVQPADNPYAAALAAFKLVAAGRELKLMDTRDAQYLAYYHIVSASKMVPETLPVT